MSARRTNRDRSRSEAWARRIARDQQNRLDRETTLELFTRGSAWMSREDDVKGSIAPGKYADFTTLSADYFQVPDNEIQHIMSVLTVVDGVVTIHLRLIELNR